MIEQIIAKLAENMAGAADRHILSVAERRLLMNSAGLRTPLVIDPRLLEDQLVSIDRRTGKLVREALNNVVVVAAMRERPFAHAPASIFVGEVITDGLPYRDTGLYRAFAAGQKMRRYVHTETGVERKWVTSDEQFEQYYRKCLRLADSIRRSGVLDLDSEKADRLILAEDRKKDHNIGIAIDACGKVLAFKSGQHRLALAKALGVRRIPVSLRLISATHLASLAAGADLARPEVFLAGLRDAAGRISLAASSP